jgi:long-chain acyl-CoA synthetase
MEEGRLSKRWEAHYDYWVRPHLNYPRRSLIDVLRSLLNHPHARQYGLDRIRAFNSGSAPLPLEVLDQFEAMTGGTLCEGYGLSEASPVTHTSPTLSVRKPGSIGIPLQDTDMKVVDLEDGTRELPIAAEGDPSEVGGVLFTHPAVMEAAVIGVPDSYRGEVVEAFVVLKPGASCTLDELRAHCTANLAEFKRPVNVEIRETLPKSAVGKVLRRLLREEEP